MIYAVFGSDSYQIREQVELLEESARRAGISPTRLEAKELSPDQLRDHLSSGSLFASRAVLIIRNLFSEGSADLKDAASTLLERIPEGVTVILWEESPLDQRTRLYRLLVKKAKLVEKRPLHPAALRQWIQKRAQELGLRLGPGSLDALVESVGADLFQLEQEMEKLTLFAAGRVLEPGEVRQLVAASLPPSIFDLLDALGDPRGQAALLVEQLLSGGEDPLHLFSMLAYQLRNLLLVDDLSRRKPNVSVTEVARQLRLHPFVAQKTLAQSRRFTQEELVRLHHQLADFDHAIKTGALDTSQALLLFVSRLPTR